LHRNRSLLSASINEEQSTYRKMTMTERSSKKDIQPNVALTHHELLRTKTVLTNIENNDGRVDTVGDSNQDTSRITNQILKMRKITTSFISETKTD